MDQIPELDLTKKRERSKLGNQERGEVPVVVEGIVMVALLVLSFFAIIPVSNPPRQQEFGSAHFPCMSAGNGTTRALSPTRSK